MGESNSRNPVLNRAIACYTRIPIGPPPLLPSSGSELYLMERAVRVFTGKKFSRDLWSDGDVARAAWAAAVGKAINSHTSRIKLVRSTLVVEVEDAVWQKQLHSLTPQILERLRKLTGSDAIQDLEFRIGIPRRQPHRAGSRTTTEDEADSIQDPVLQKIYRLSRKKATG